MKRCLRGDRASGSTASGSRASGGRASGGRASGGRAVINQKVIKRAIIASGDRASGSRASGSRASGGRASGGKASGIAQAKETCHYHLTLPLISTSRLMAEYDFVFETPYDNQTPASFVCTIDRPKNPTNPASMMYVMNHFLYGVTTIGTLEVEIPQPGIANTTNSDASLGAEARLCNSTFNRIPNFLAVDFYDEGQVFQVAAQLNGVPYVAKQLGTNQTSSTSPNQATSTGFSINISFGSAAAKEREIGWVLSAVMILVFWAFMM